MTKVDRRLFRSQMKKEYKKFVKENPAYKNMTFAQFVELVKVNMVKLKKQAVAKSVLDTDAHTHSHDHNHEDHNHDLQDMFTSVVEDNNETAATSE